MYSTQSGFEQKIKRSYNILKFFIVCRFYFEEMDDFRINMIFEGRRKFWISFFDVIYEHLKIPFSLKMVIPNAIINKLPQITVYGRQQTGCIKIILKSKNPKDEMCKYFNEDLNRCKNSKLRDERIKKKAEFLVQFCIINLLKAANNMNLL